MPALVAMPPVEPPTTADGTKVPLPEQPAEDSPLYKTDEFRMFCFKVLPCSKRYVHDWTVCPFAHPGEKAKRRDPRVFTYTGIACPDMKKCQRGDACPYAHNVFEYWMHPSRYRTQLCNDGIGCKRKVCFFAHTLDELRVSSVKLLPSDIAAGADAGAFDVDPFRVPRSDSGRTASKSASSGSSAAAAAGGEALVEALRAQQQQQQHQQQAKKAAAVLQRSASRGLAAELQQLHALQQLQAVLANTPGLGVMQSQQQQQQQQQQPGQVDSLLGAMMAQLRLGGVPPQQPVVSQLGPSAPGLLDVVVQQAVQQVIANNAAQQAAAALMLLQQQQQQQQNQQAAQAQAIFEHLLQQQQQGQQAAGGGNPHAMQAALAILHQQQHGPPPPPQQPVPPMGPMGFAGPNPAGAGPMPMGPPMGLGMEPLHSCQSMSPPAMIPQGMAPMAQPGQHASLPGSVRSSATGMSLNGALSVPSPVSAAAKLTGDGTLPPAAPSSPRSMAVVSPSGSPPLDTPLCSALSDHHAAASAALSAAATAASYYSQEASRSSFESYRSSELELGLQMASGYHSSGPSSGGAARTSLDLLQHVAQQPQHPGMLMGSAPSPACNASIPMDNNVLLRQQQEAARHRQLLMAAAAAHASGNGVSQGMNGGPGGPSPAAVPQEFFADQVTMAAFTAGQQCPAPPFGM